MAQVHANDTHIDRLLRAFKRCVDREGKAAVVRQDTHVKPTTDRKCKRAAARKRWLKLKSKEEESRKRMRGSQLYRKRTGSLLRKPGSNPEAALNKPSE